MAKKKVRDFNKVKLKLGRTLKRQNETVVDLSTKKILLPREKAHVNHDIQREPNTVLYEHIQRLQMSGENLQLCALSCIQSILSPYVAQINADWNTQPFVCYNKKSLESLNNLLGFDSPQNDVALQFGDLFESLDRLSRHSTSAHLPLEIARLCSMIVTIFSVHPRIHCALICLDNIALSLLHRSEFWYRNAGVRILGDLMDSRHRVVTSLACTLSPLVPFLWLDQLCALIDANNHSIRKNTYARLLIRHFGSLHESTAFDTVGSRKTLLMSTMKYLRDVQYTTYVTPVVPIRSSSLFKLHPFLSPVELPRLPLEESSLRTALTDSSLGSVWMLLPSNPIFDKLSMPSFVQQGGNKPKGRSLPLANESLTKAEENSLPEWTLIICVLKEGHRLLDELIHSPDVETVFGLIFTIRCLRVFLETNPCLASMSDSRPLPDVETPLVQFTQHLCELVPPDCAGETLVPEAKARGGDGDGTYLSRKQLKRASKRAAKLARRQGAAGLRRGDDTSEKHTKEATTAGRLDRSEVLAHLLKQQTLQLMWSLAVDGAMERTVVRDFSRSLATFFLTTKQVGDDEGESLPPLAFLHLVSSALAWRWIHCLDFCLLYNSRIRRLPLGSELLACFVAPMVTALVYIVHRWCRRQQSSVLLQPSNAPPLRAPRLVVRSTGLLVTFLYQELRAQLWSGRASLFSPHSFPTADSTDQPQSLLYDSTWIRATLRDLKVDLPFPGPEDLFSTLAEDLCDLVERESLKPDSCRARWVWAAACLNSLAGIKYANVLERLKQSPGLCESVELLKGWTCSTEALEDPLVYLPCPETGTYPSVRSWKCLSVERSRATQWSPIYHLFSFTLAWTRDVAMDRHVMEHRPPCNPFHHLHAHRYVSDITARNQNAMELGGRAPESDHT
ncbi:hypothetical protein ECG_03924 [Echinococcus granulosus]|uniref:Ipi1_N domain-containing protein n=1 Tax=Echinococcus granulosus TaxID=6210 RepID=A0A068WJG2_ECHGR|nr:hypothetical protein ECG_03924 [Echinococcus granulosus]CDS17808.1 hypothetical protein EgrG_001057500 [Echinococcus granulosus]